MFTNLQKRWRDVRLPAKGRAFGGQKNMPIAAAIVGGQAEQPIWTPRSYETLAYEGFQKNPIVYRAVSLIARSVASVPWSLYRGDQQLTTHPLLTLLHGPNKREGRISLVESLVAYLLLAGNTYVEAVAKPGGLPQELYILRPDRVRLIPQANGEVMGYEYTVNGESLQLPAAQVLHMRQFHPLNDWYGMSPMEPIAGSIDQHNAVSAHNLSYLQNGARPTAALILKNDGRRPPLTPEQRQEYIRTMDSVFSGATNAGRVLLLEGDMAWHEVGTRLKDLDFIEGKTLSAREIAQAYGVPPMLVGVVGESTYANYREARFHFWEDTVLPLLDRVIAAFNTWLVTPFGLDLRFVPAIDTIPALAPRREMTWDKIANASFLTVDEKRQALGYAKLPLTQAL